MTKVVAHPIITLEFVATKEIAEAVAVLFLARQDEVSGVRVEYQRPDGIWTWVKREND